MASRAGPFPHSIESSLKGCFYAEILKKDFFKIKANPEQSFDKIFFFFFSFFRNAFDLSIWVIFSKLTLPQKHYKIAS